jgi:hypothetical protein
VAIDTSDRGEHLAAPGQRGQRDALRVLDTSRGQILQVGSDARRTSRRVRNTNATSQQPLRRSRNSWVFLFRMLRDGPYTHE